MNEHQKLAIKALEAMKGDDTARARSAFRNFTPKQMHQCYGENEKTPTQILAAYEADDAKVDASIDWVKNATFLKED